MMEKESAYGNSDIVTLKGAERVRQKPEVFFGSNSLDGCVHAFFEILSNSVDEAKAGFGRQINITAYTDRSIEVEDFGRGIPLGYNEKEGRYNWDLIFCELFAGGKYSGNKQSSNYEYSLGTNGLGACATQYASEFMNVKSYSAGMLSEIDFKLGDPVTDLRVSPLEKNKTRTGTVIHWKPDNTVFTSIRIPKERYTEILKRQSIVNSGVRFNFRWQENDGTFSTSEFYYEHGIIDYVSSVAEGGNISTPLYWEEEVTGFDERITDSAEPGAGRVRQPYKLKMSVSFCFTQSTKLMECYHNSSYLAHGGAPVYAIHSAFNHMIDKYCRDKNKYTKGEAPITNEDIDGCLVIVTNCFSDLVSYENQTKMSISDRYIREEMNSFFRKNLEIYFTENAHDADRIADQVLIFKRSREKAAEIVIRTKNNLTAKIDIANRVEKFVGCRSKDETKRELYIVEGDSAMTSVKLARQAEFQAIIPVRGKTLNCLKSDYEKIFKSPIITDLIRVVGCGVELDKSVKTDIPKFDPANMKWSKIVICTDADEDGFQIRTLILTLFYRLMPTLISMGRIYIAESPLFEITVKDKTYYAYDERDKNRILSEIGNVKYTLQRSKGLGENTPEMMSETTMNPLTRRLVRVTEADATETAEIFDTLLGDNIVARKQYIAENGSKYIYEADI